MAVTSTSLKRHPFLIGPDPSLLYLTPSLKATLQKVRLVLDMRQGLTAILGDVGMGKTSVLRYLHGQYVNRDDCVTAYLPTPKFKSDFAFLKAICGEYEITAKRSMQAQENELRGYLASLYAEGKTAVLFIDEAQLLPRRDLELVRLLLNIETDKTKLLQIVLVAQLELGETLRDKSMKAIRSRIFAPSLLAPLTLNETREMVAYRCDMMQVANPFSDEAVEALYMATGGVPRVVLQVALLAWETAKRIGETSIPASVIAEIAAEASYVQSE
jgi:MSHA biogenesis protein MshM